MIFPRNPYIFIQKFERPYIYIHIYLIARVQPAKYRDFIPKDEIWHAHRHLHLLIIYIYVYMYLFICVRSLDHETKRNSMTLCQ